MKCYSDQRCQQPKKRSPVGVASMHVLSYRSPRILLEFVRCQNRCVQSGVPGGVGCGAEAPRFCGAFRECGWYDLCHMFSPYFVMSCTTQEGEYARVRSNLSEKVFPAQPFWDPTV